MTKLDIGVMAGGVGYAFGLLIGLWARRMFDWLHVIQTRKW